MIFLISWPLLTPFLFNIFTGSITQRSMCSLRKAFNWIMRSGWFQKLNMIHIMYIITTLSMIFLDLQTLLCSHILLFLVISASYICSFIWALCFLDFSLCFIRGSVNMSMIWTHLWILAELYLNTHRISIEILWIENWFSSVSSSRGLFIYGFLMQGSNYMSIMWQLFPFFGASSLGFACMLFWAKIHEHMYFYIM